MARHPHEPISVGLTDGMTERWPDRFICAESVDWPQNDGVSNRSRQPLNGDHFMNAPDRPARNLIEGRPAMIVIDIQANTTAECRLHLADSTRTDEGFRSVVGQVPHRVSIGGSLAFAQSLDESAWENCHLSPR